MTIDYHIRLVLPLVGCGQMNNVQWLDKKPNRPQDYEQNVNKLYPLNKGELIPCKISRNIVKQCQRTSK